ncbi:MAG: N-acetylneuraminate synthase family protein [Desulfarculaceae bacterium]|nr:N-acetylneuraminate synthase family protein [Desulfarculaceae bacterium]MCF8072922.1 N-acetylneuraminate synthase family protein [Desulfarculaceae bacterium]MCF8101090.1 N-acetylneuraminate synthase family protein [Desulfarculaceae bacterium]MCF8115523.1 N-acetylneuraminate synthase family protein [Desulfarculaceae bacterium]
MDYQSLKLGERELGTGAKPLVIAEVAQAHDGSLGLAHSYIDAAASAGADAVKFQTHIAAAESTRDEQFRVPFSYEDATRYDYWRRMEFTPEQWAGLAEHCAKAGVIFLSSPFSVQAAELLEGLGMVAWKLASGELDHEPLLEFMAATQKPAIISSGMSGWEELGRVVGFFRKRGCPVALMQCTTAYPAPLEQAGLDNIGLMKERFAAPAGLSDHSGTIFPAMAALARGADLVEVHLVFDKAMFGPDAKASLTPAELTTLCQGRDAVVAMRATVDKDTVAAEKAELRSLFGRSLAPVKDLPAGHVLEADDLILKKPGGGIPWEQLGSLLGRRLARPAPAERLLRPEDIED